MSQYPTQPPPLNYADPAIRPPPRRFRFGAVFGGVFLIGVAILLFLLLSSRPTTSNARIIPLSEFADRLEGKQIHRVVVERDELRGTCIPPRSSYSQPDGVPFRTALPPGMGENWGFLQWLLANRGNAEVVVRNTDNNYVINILLPVIPWLLIFFFLWFFVFRQRRKTGATPGATIVTGATIITGPGRWVPDPQPDPPSPPQPEANRP
jgi:ATP-dependent Zn protease